MGVRTVFAVAVLLMTSADASAQVPFKPRPEKDDPHVDPKIRLAPPADVEHSMRKITPSVCQPK